MHSGFTTASEVIDVIVYRTSLHEYCHFFSVSGHVDPGEKEFDTALRETQEEAGLTKDHLNIIDGFKMEIHYDVRGKPKTVIYWLSELKDLNTSVKISHEHTDFKWLALSEAVEYAKYENTKKAIIQADEFIRKKIKT